MAKRAAEVIHAINLFSSASFAFAEIHFWGYEAVPEIIYYGRRKLRDESARKFSTHREQ